MKKVTQLFLAVAALATIVIAGCKGGSSDPKAVLTAFFEKLAKKDIDGAAKYATKASKSTLDMMKKGLEMAEKMGQDAKEKDPTEEFKNLEFGDAKISGDSATVTVTKKGEEPFDFPLVKEDGSWKVDFSMATLMKMGKEKGEMESMEELEGVSSDSVNKEVQKMADSIIQNIDPKQLEDLKKSVEQLKEQQ